MTVIALQHLGTTNVGEHICELLGIFLPKSSRNVNQHGLILQMVFFMLAGAKHTASLSKSGTKEILRSSCNNFSRKKKQIEQLVQLMLIMEKKYTNMSYMRKKKLYTTMQITKNYHWSLPEPVERKSYSWVLSSAQVSSFRSE